MSDDLQAVRADLVRWQQENEFDAIRAELVRRGVEPKAPSQIDAGYQEVVEEFKRRAERADELEARLAAIEADPRRALTEAMQALAETLAIIAKPAEPRPPSVTVRTIERDRDGNIARIVEQQVDD